MILYERNAFYLRNTLRNGGGGQKGGIYNLADVVIPYVYWCNIDPVFHKRRFDAKIILLIRQRTVNDT